MMGLADVTQGLFGSKCGAIDPDKSDPSAMIGDCRINLVFEHGFYFFGQI